MYYDAQWLTKLSVLVYHLHMYVEAYQKCFNAYIKYIRSDVYVNCSHKSQGCVQDRSG